MTDLVAREALSLVLRNQAATMEGMAAILRRVIGKANDEVGKLVADELIEMAKLAQVASRALRTE